VIRVVRGVRRPGGRVQRERARLNREYMRLAHDLSELGRRIEQLYMAVRLPRKTRGELRHIRLECAGYSAYLGRLEMLSRPADRVTPPKALAASGGDA